MNQNVVGWFEIPVTDMDRAVKFYESVFEVTLERHTFGSLEMAWFPGVENGSGTNGSLVLNKAYKPSENGVLIYFTARSGVTEGLSRAEKSGGKILLQRTPVSENFGYMGLFTDSEGNRIALHSMDFDSV